MLAGVAGQALERLRQFQDGAGVLFLLDPPGELRLLRNGFFERDAQFHRDQLGNAVNEAVTVAEHPAAIPHHGAGRHGAVCDDLADLVTAVGVGHVINDKVAFFHAEIDVEVGHSNSNSYCSGSSPVMPST